MQTIYEDVSAKKEYIGLIGAEYRVVDKLYAYGIRKHSKADVDYVVLQPPPGFSGSEVGFKSLIPTGTIFKIVKVLRTNRWFDPPMSLEVKLVNHDLASNALVIIDLMHGNELAKTNTLNPDLFQKI